MTFAPYFLQLPFLGTVITDTHFVTRDRMGRLLAFVGALKAYLCPPRFVSHR
jgi:cyanophycinase-like exopeptidase